MNLELVHWFSPNNTLLICFHGRFLLASARKASWQIIPCPLSITFSGTLDGHTFCGGLLWGKLFVCYLVTFGWPVLTLWKISRFLGPRKILNGHTFCGGLLWGKSSLWYLIGFEWPVQTLRNISRFLGLKIFLDGHTFCGGLLWGKSSLWNLKGFEWPVRTLKKISRFLGFRIFWMITHFVAVFCVGNAWIFAM